MCSKLIIITRYAFFTLFGCLILLLIWYGCQQSKKSDNHLDNNVKIDNPNLIVYVIDALRADHLGCYGYPFSTSPNIDKLSKQSLLFTHLTAQSSWTRPTIATVLTGLLPKKHGALTDDDQLSEKHVLLPEILQSKGYENYAFIANGNVSGWAGFDQGYHRFYMFDEEIGKVGLLTRSEKLNIAIIPTLLNFNREKKYFVYIHAVDPHHPYLPGEKCFSLHNSITFNEDYFNAKHYREIHTNDISLQQMVAAYNDEIRFNDKMFGIMLHTLKRKEMLSNSIIVLTSDHGEEFLDHGGFLHGYNLFEEQLRVPLIMKLLNHKQVISSKMVNQVDILPSFCHLLKCPIPSFIDGNNFFDNSFHREVSYSELKYPSRKKKHYVSVNKDNSKLVVLTLTGFPGDNYKWFSNEANIPIDVDEQYLDLVISANKRNINIIIQIDEKVNFEKTITPKIETIRIYLPKKSPILLSIISKEPCLDAHNDSEESPCKNFRIFGTEDIDLEKLYEKKTFYFFNLKRDPNEQNKVEPENIKQVQGLLESYRHYTSFEDKPLYEVPRVVLSERQEAELKALGYIE